MSVLSCVVACVLILRCCEYVLYVSFGMKVRPRTYEYAAMSSAVLFILYCTTQNKQISLPQIILTQSRRQITSMTTMPPLQHTHTHATHHLFNCTHIRTIRLPLDLWTDPAGVMERLARWRDKLAGGPKAG